MDTLLVISLLVGAGTAWSQVQSPRSEERGRDRASDPITSEAMRSDAELTDVCFVDRKTGWAVGDRGVIWHTADGGKDWEIQPSGVSCRLESVSFISPEVGWAVGWTAHPYSQAGAGVLLWTRDGGRQWNEDRKLILPALKRVRFFGPRSGWAIGSPSAVFPSGILTTDSGGRSWNPVSGEAGRGWCTGDFLSMETAVVAGCGGRLARVRRGQIEAVQQQGFGLQNPARLKFSGPNLGWLVGEGGMVLQTDDQGATCALQSIGSPTKSPGSLISPRWRRAGPPAGSPARPARGSSIPRMPAGSGLPPPPARACRFEASRSSTTAVVGRSGNWAPSWRHRTAGRLGHGSGPVEPVPRSWACSASRRIFPWIC